MGKDERDKVKPLPCGHSGGTFKDQYDIEYCSVCSQATDIDDYMQKVANLLRAPVLGQLIGKSTVYPTERQGEKS